MAKAKEPSAQDAVLIFKDVLERSRTYPMVYQNRIIHFRHKDGHSVLTVAEAPLWSFSRQDPDIRSMIMMHDVEKNPELLPIFHYGEGMEYEDWFPLDPEKMYLGNLIHLKLDGFEYDIPVNVRVFPLKLRKNEFNNFEYRVTQKDRIVLSIRKKFEYPIPGYSFYMVVPFQVI